VGGTTDVPISVPNETMPITPVPITPVPKTPVPISVPNAPAQKPYVNPTPVPTDLPVMVPKQPTNPISSETPYKHNMGKI
jgi:hypothetical protein